MTVERWVADQVPTVITGGDLVFDRREAVSSGRPLVSDIPRRRATIGVVRFDITAHTLHLDARASEIFAAPADRSGLEVWRERVHPDDVHLVRTMFENARTSLGAECLYRIVLPDGTVRQVLTRSMAIDPTEDRRSDVLTAVVFEVGAESGLTRVLDHVSVGFLVLGEHMVIRYLNSESERHLGVHRSEVVGRHLHDALPRTRDSFVGDFYRDVLSTRGEVTIRTASLYLPGRVIEATGNYVDGQVAINFRDITDQVEQTSRLVDAYQDLLDRSRHDELTGVLNRAALVERLTRPGDDTATPTVLLFVDIDDFKTVNDTHGHAAGDLVLRTLAQRLLRHCGPGGVVGRIGGDEFVIALFAPVSDHDGHRTNRLTELLHRSARVPIAHAGHRIEVSISIGVAHNRGSARLADLLTDADVALYRAKSARRVPTTGAATTRDERTCVDPPPTNRARETGR